MIEEFIWLMILLIFAMLFFYSNSKISNTIEDYRLEKNVINNNNLEIYRDRKRIRDAKVIVGGSPFRKSNFLLYDDNEFGSHSIYEVGKIISVIQNNSNYPNYYSSNYANNYSGYV